MCKAMPEFLLFVLQIWSSIDDDFVARSDSESEDDDDMAVQQHFRHQKPCFRDRTRTFLYIFTHCAKKIIIKHQYLSFIYEVFRNTRLHFTACGSRGPIYITLVVTH